MKQAKHKRGKGEKTLEILEAISETALDMLGVFVAVSLSGAYGYPNKKNVKRALKDWDKAVNQFGETIDRIIKNARERRNFRILLFKLKKQGLIKSSHKKLFLTKAGWIKIAKLKEGLILNKSYKKEADNKLRIVIFDIPEKYRKKRDWIRLVLKNLDFQMLQRSVWAGKTIIPEDFLSDLQRLELFPYVEIFTMGDEGTIVRKIKT